MAQAAPSHLTLSWLPLGAQAAAGNLSCHCDSLGEPGPTYPMLHSHLLGSEGMLAGLWLWTLETDLVTGLGPQAMGTVT